MTYICLFGGVLGAGVSLNSSRWMSFPTAARHAASVRRSSRAHSDRSIPSIQNPVHRVAGKAFISFASSGINCFTSIFWTLASLGVLQSDHVYSRGLHAGMCPWYDREGRVWKASWGTGLWTEPDLLCLTSYFLELFQNSELVFNNSIILSRLSLMMMMKLLMSDTSILVPKSCNIHSRKGQNWKKYNKTASAPQKPWIL